MHTRMTAIGNANVDVELLFGSGVGSVAARGCLDAEVNTAIWERGRRRSSRMEALAWSQVRGGSEPASWRPTTKVRGRVLLIQ